MVYITRALATVLIDLAKDADPEGVTTGVSVMRAGDLDGADAIAPDTPVFTDFLLPKVGNPVNYVFGVELSTPAREAQGRFVSHPVGELEVSKRDHLAEVIFVAVPPWGTEDSSFAAFDRTGARRPLEFVDATPPDGVLPEDRTS